MSEHNDDGLAPARERGFFGRGGTRSSSQDMGAASAPENHAELPDAYAGPEHRDDEFQTVAPGAAHAPAATQSPHAVEPIHPVSTLHPAKSAAVHEAGPAPESPSRSVARVEILPPALRRPQQRHDTGAAQPGAAAHSAGAQRPHKIEPILKTVGGEKKTAEVKRADPIPPVRDGAYQGLIGELLRSGVMDQAHADNVIEEATRLRRQPSEILLKRGMVPRAEVYAAMQRLRMSITVRSATELPEWDTVLNDAGGPIGGRERDPEIAVVAVASDLTHGNNRCFVICTEAARATPAFARITARRLAAGYDERAVVVTDVHVLGVVYAQWEARGGTAAVRARRQGSDTHALFDKIALDAFRMGASDIHYTCTRGAMVVKVRVHGELERYPIEMTQDQGRALAESMYNTMPEAGSTRGGFDPRSTQDAVIDRSYPEGSIRFRYSGLPLAPDGFDITLRIIPVGVQSRPKTMRELGYSEDQCEMLSRFFAKSSGLILFCGTTGSGKSTTLANSLRLLAKEYPTKKIRTVEEPVEYIIEGAEQTPVTRNQKSGGGEGGGSKEDDKQAFLAILRQIMRADPDILMVGEIRDQATAELALSGVRSGHLLASTIHADGAPIVYDRLAGMGISRLDMASVNLVSGLIYQRLVPVLCDRCKVPVKSALDSRDQSLISLFKRLRVLQGKVHGLNEANMFDDLYLRNPSGCEACKNRGITGQTVAAEILRPTPNMLDAIARGDSRELWRLWRATIKQEDPDDMTGRTAFEHAVWKMRHGIVSPRSVEHAFQPLDQPPFEDN